MAVSTADESARFFVTCTSIKKTEHIYNSSRKIFKSKYSFIFARERHSPKQEEVHMYHMKKMFCASQP